LILGLVVLGAALMRFWGLDFGLPNLQCRPDETGIVIKALAFFGGDLNPHFFRYPTLYFYLLALVFAVYMLGCLMLGATSATLLVDIAMDPSVYVLISRGVSASLGTLTVLAVFWLARRLAGERVGLVAAFLMGACYLHVRESHFGLTDVAMTLSIVCSMGFVWAVYQRGNRCDYVLAGLLTGLSASTKYAGIFLIAPMCIAHVKLWMAKREELEPQTLFGVLKDRNIYGYGLCTVVGFVALTPFAVLDFTTFWHDVMAESLHLDEGHAGLSVGLGWGYHAFHTLPGGVGWPVLSGAIFGFLVLLRRDIWQAAVLGAFPIVFYLVAGKGQTVFVRYMVPVLPFVCVFCAVGLNAVVARFSIRESVSNWALIVLCLVVSGPSVYRTLYLDRLLALDDSRVVAARWVEDHVPEGHTIYQSGTGWAHAQLIPSVATLESRLVRQQQAGKQGRLLQTQIDQVRAGVRSHAGYEILDYDPDDPIWKKTDLPAYVVLYESPLNVYTPLPKGLTDWVDTHYKMVEQIVGVGQDTRAWFDQLDAFFVPYTGLDSATRTGPDVRIYFLDSAK